MMEKKMTKKAWFTEIIAIVEVSNADEEIKNGAVEMLKNQIASLDKKSSHTGLTKTQKENLEIAEEIKNALAETDKAVTITELQKISAKMAEYSNQKLSAILKNLVEKEGTVEKVIDKKRSLFKLKNNE